LADELGTLSRRAVFTESSDGHVLAFYPDEDEMLDERLAQSILQPSHQQVAIWLRSVVRSSSAEPPVRGWTDAAGWTRLVAPILGRHGILGNINLLIPTNDERPEDTILLSRAAAASAVILAQEQATTAARREVELNVLDELLDGALRSDIALAQQAERLGHNLDQSFIALVARTDTQQTGAARSREQRTQSLETGVRAFVSQLNQPDVLWRVRNANVEVVLPDHVLTAQPDVAKRLQGTLNQALANHQINDAVSIGIGRVAGGMQGIRRSHQDARQALTLGRRLHGGGHITDYDDLGIYRLILAAENLPELRTFHDESLGDLVEYDRVHNSNLVHTLEAFFAANCSPKEAASILQVHRNTVLYRLERIADIAGLDLDDPDVRLRFHLALYVRTALGA
jgi:purine catabolism regulator